MRKAGTSVNTYRSPITHLAKDEVFVFGANPQGFHGAGSAGFASFNRFGNVWREEGYANRPNGWQGKWNVKGKVGPQVGTEGKSYGLITVAKAGAKRSRTEEEMVEEFEKLYACCNRNPRWFFFLAQTGKVGLNGWSPDEMASFMISAGDIPENLHIDETFAPFFEDK